MKTSEILRRAKKHLDMHDSTCGICFAIWEVADPTTNKKVAALTDDIERRISPFSMAHHWLGLHLSGMTLKQYLKASALTQATVRCAAYNYSDRDVQRWRKRWMDTLIEEYKAKGD